jgi:GGDEF domain-containing protein
VISIELGVFDDVRRAAGQLFAQRVVRDAARRVEAMLRNADEIACIGDDRFAIVTSVADQQQLDAIADRIMSCLHDLPVPRGSSQPRPRLRAVLMPEALADSQLAEAVRALDDATRRRRAG